MGVSKKKLIKSVLSNRCAHNSLKFFFIKRWLYTIKAFLCIVFGLYYDFELNEDQSDVSKIVRGIARFDPKPVPWHPDSDVCHWTEIGVGRGLFRNWFYETYHNYSSEGNIPNGYTHGSQNVNMSCLWYYGNLSSGTGGDNLPSS